MKLYNCHWLTTEAYEPLAALSMTMSTEHNHVCTTITVNKLYLDSKQDNEIIKKIMCMIDSN